MQFRDKKTEIVIRIAQSAGIIAVAALFFWADREGMEGSLTGGRELAWGLGFLAVLVLWNGWAFDYWRARQPDNYLDRITAPKRKFAHETVEKMRSLALKALGDPRVFTLRPAAGVVPPAALPEGIPVDLRQLLKQYSFIGISNSDDTYLSAECLGPSKLAKKAVRVGYNDGNEVVYFPGEQVFYEMYAVDTDYEDRLVLFEKDKGEKFPSIYHWLATAAYEKSKEGFEELLAVADDLIREAEEDGDL